MQKWVGVIIMLLLTACTSQTVATPKAQNGNLDLSQLDFEKQGLVALDGYWELYWNQLLEPSDFQANPAKSAVVLVPGQWTEYQVNGQPLPGYGCATFRLLTQVNKINQLYGLKLGDVGTAYRIWANGQKVISNGTVGCTRETTTPRNERHVAFFTANQNTIELVIQVSNFDDPKGGIWPSVYFGLADDIERQREKDLALDLFLCGSLLVIGLYHIGLYSLRRKDNHFLYFGLFCSMIALRTIVMGENFLSILLPSLSWMLLLKIEYTTFYFGVPVFIAFLYSLYPANFNGWFLKLLQRLGLLFGGVVVLTPPYFFTHTLPYMQILTLIAGLYLIYGLIRAIIQQQEGAFIIGLGQLIFLGTAINDILYANTIIQTGFFTSFGLLAFVFLQSLALSMRFSRTFTKVEALSEQLSHLHHELEIANNDLQAYSQTLEQKVTQRTTALVMANEQLQKEITERKQAQQETAVFAQVVEHIGYALIDQNLIVLSSNTLFNQWIENKPKTIVGQPLNETFIELVGFEQTLQELFDHSNQRATLARIYRPSQREQGDYFSLEFELLYASQNILLALISDETAHAYLEGQLKQERNELWLNIIQRKQAETALREAHQVLEKRVDELSTLNLITQTVSMVLDLDLVLNMVAKQMTQIFNARSTGIALFKNSSIKLTVTAYYSQEQNEPSAIGVEIPIEGNLSTQHVLTTRRPLNVTDPQTNALTASIHELMRQRGTRSLLIIPIISRGKIFGTIGIDTAEIGHTFTPEQISLAETITGQIAGVIDNARLFDKVQQANMRMHDELNLARKIQYGLLPSPKFIDDNITIVCYTMPAREVSGDFYNYHVFNHRYAIAVGDVSGKGVSASLLMATALAQLDSHLTKGLSPTDMLAALDKAIMPYTKPRRQNCAMCYVEIEIKDLGFGILDLGLEDEPKSKIQNLKSKMEIIQNPKSKIQNSLLSIVNAGCIPPYIKRTTGEVVEIELGGFALGQGLGAEVGYQQMTLDLSKGDLVILSSDGIVEANNMVNKMLGFERLKQIVFTGPTTSAEAMLEHLKRELFAFTGEAEPHDDMTLVVVQV